MKRLFLILLFFTLIETAWADSSFWTDVTWTTPDGVKMAGLLHKPALPSHYTWVLLHGLGSNKEEWDTFARRLGIQGQGVFIYDLRGHGASNQTVQGETISYHSWQTGGPGTAWEAMPGDLAGAVEMVHKRYQIPYNRIAVGGASLGANVALIYASQSSKVPALILLSPGLSYAGIESEPALKRFGRRPLFMAASPDDRYAYSSVIQLAQWRKDPDCFLAEGPGAMHGVNMFQGSFTQQLLDWMNKVEKH